jgi:DNA modification methylase
MSLPTPYYDMDGITIYHGDCREILRDYAILQYNNENHKYLSKVDLILTDPPYPDYHAELYQYTEGMLNCLSYYNCLQKIFWTSKVTFPLDYTAIHIWDKKTGVSSEYERIFERYGQYNYKVYRFYLINSTVAASFTGDTFTGHPSQKPIKLIKTLINDAQTILDPFMGSGTTLVAAKQLGRKAIGIEIEEKYCEIAVKRLGQGILNF